LVKSLNEPIDVSTVQVPSIPAVVPVEAAGMPEVGPAPEPVGELPGERGAELPLAAAGVAKGVAGPEVLVAAPVGAPALADGPAREPISTGGGPLGRRNRYQAP
jgi:hypothetical protein